MNSRKALIYFALALLSFSLYSSWDQFQKKSPQQQEGAGVVTSSLNKAPEVKVKNVIKVETPQQRIYIDKKGGRVIRNELKDYKVNKNGKTNVHVLTSNPKAPFYASSGITGDSDLLYSAPVKVFDTKKSGKRLVLKARSVNGVEYQKTFEFLENYQIKVSTKISNNSAKEWYGQGYVDFSGSNFINMKGKSSEPEANDFNAGSLSREHKSGFFGTTTYVGAAYYKEDSPYNKLTYNQMSTKGINLKVKNSWIAIQKRYFLAALVPQKDQTYDLVSQWNSGYVSNNKKEYVQQFNIRMLAPTQTISPGESTSFSSTLYTGPEVAKDLAALSPGLDKTIDYGMLWFISEVIFWVMDHIHSVIKNWGISIILTTFIIKLLFYRLQEKSNESMAKLKKFGPMIEEIQSKYEDDPEAKNKAMLDLYKKEKINPLGGCLPLLIQIPFFISLMHVVMEAVQIRHKAFLWIPDLASYDPYYILPLILGASMLVQTRMTPTSTDPAQAKMAYLLPVVFTALFSQVPAGVGIYFFTNTVLTVLQQYRSSIRQR